MKKFVSMFTIVATVLTMSSVSVFADYASTLTMSSTAIDNKATSDQEVIVSTTLGDSKGIKGLSYKFTFDNRDFELGVSEDAKEYYMNSEYEEDLNLDYDGDWEALTKDFCGHYSYVDDTYNSTWKTYTIDEKAISAPEIFVFTEGNTTTVAFGYSRSAAITTAKRVREMLVGGIVLKVKTSEKKPSTITLTEATASGADGIDTPSTIANSITLDLNGYTGEQAEDEVNKTYEGTTQKDGTGTQAVSFRRTVAIQSGTLYWEAKFGETTKYCKAVTGVNLSGGGNVKFGLVYVGTETISDVTLTWK